MSDWGAQGIRFERAATPTVAQMQKVLDAGAELARTAEAYLDAPAGMGEREANDLRIAIETYADAIKVAKENRR